MFFIKKNTFLKFIIICLCVIPYFYAPKSLADLPFNIVDYNLMVLLGSAFPIIFFYILHILYPCIKNYMLNIPYYEEFDEEEAWSGVYYITIMAQIVTYIILSI